MSRYDALHDWLLGLEGTETTVTFSDVEQIISGELPHSARKYQAWWANQNPPSSQSMSWLSAGWRAYPNLTAESVDFKKTDFELVEITRQEAAVLSRDPSATPANYLSEDSVKTLLCAHLKREGWMTTVAMAAAHGIDVDARRDTERWIIEVKGCGSLNAMRVNYFLSVLGETLQRMDDHSAKYSIAFPDIEQFRRLWERLPELAKRRTSISCLFVRDDGQVEEV
jgi:hypothetical protein